MQPYLHVCLTPALIDQFDVSNAVVIVIDVLRATTSMCVAFGSGAKCIVPVADVETAKKLGAKGYLMAGERDGLKVEGFDLGNSPFDFSEEHVKDQSIVMTTTNGTRALKAAHQRGAQEIAIGSFANINFLCDWLIQRQQSVMLLCAGWKDHSTLEDTLLAGAIVHRLRNEFAYYQDTCLMALALYKHANHRKRMYMQQSSHFNRLVHLRLQRDFKFAMRRDTNPVLPILINDTLFDAKDHIHELETFRQLTDGRILFDSSEPLKTKPQ